MSAPVELKTDNRYKDGNVVFRKGKLVGNSKTMALKHLVVPLANAYSNHYELMKMQLNPPIIISSELADALKEYL